MKNLLGNTRNKAAILRLNVRPKLKYNFQNRGSAQIDEVQV